jgi:hypothetical protein
VSIADHPEIRVTSCRVLARDATDKKISVAGQVVDGETSGDKGPVYKRVCIVGRGGRLRRQLWYCIGEEGAG